MRLGLAAQSVDPSVCGSGTPTRGPAGNRESESGLPRPSECLRHFLGDREGFPTSGCAEESAECEWHALG